jgi:hypothetical protein
MNMHNLEKLRDVTMILIQWYENGLSEQVFPRTCGSKHLRLLYMLKTEVSMQFSNWR